MGKDTVVIRSDVSKDVKRPLMRYPERVRQYYHSLYGVCEVIHSSSRKIGKGWHYVVVLKFQLPSVANKIKQKYNGRVLQNDARVTTTWFDVKQAQELGISPPSSSSTSSSRQQTNGSSRTTTTADRVSISSQDSVRAVTSSQPEASESEGGNVPDCLSPEGSRSNTSSYRRSRRSSLSSQDIGKDGSDSGDHPESQVSSYSCSSSLREKGHSRGESAMSQRRNKTLVTDGFASTMLNYYHSARRVSEETEWTVLHGTERKRRASSPERSYSPASKRSRDEKTSSDEKRGNIFDRLGPSQKGKECRGEPMSRSPSPQLQRTRSRHNSSRVSRERSQSPSSRDHRYSGSSKSLVGKSDKDGRTLEERKFSRGRHQSDGYGEREKTSYGEGRRASETEGRRNREVRNWREEKGGGRDRREEEREGRDKKEEEREGRDKKEGERQGRDKKEGEREVKKLKKCRRAASDTDSDGGRRSCSRIESRQSHSDDNEPVKRKCNERDSQHVKEERESEREEREICNISWDEADPTADEMETVHKESNNVGNEGLKEEPSREKNTTAHGESERTTQDSNKEAVREAGSEDHSDIITESERDSIREPPVTKGLDTPDMMEESGKDDSEAKQRDHKDDASNETDQKLESVSVTEDHLVTAEKHTPQNSPVKTEARPLEVMSPVVEPHVSRDYNDRDVTPPLEVLQSMQNSYAQPYYPALPFHHIPVSAAFSLAAYQHLFRGQEALQLIPGGPPSTALPFPVATQQAAVSGVVATPSVWPVQVASAVSPAQWHQLWLESQRILTAGATASCVSMGSVMTGTGSQTSGTGVDTIGTGTQTIRTSVDTTGSGTQTIGTNVDPTGSGTQTSVDPTGTGTQTMETCADPTGSGTQTIGTNVDPTGTGTQTMGTCADPTGSSTQTIGTNVDPTGTGTQTIGTSVDTTGTSTQTIGTGTQTIGTSVDTPGTSTQTIGTGTQTVRTSVDTTGSGTQTDSPSLQSAGDASTTPQDMSATTAHPATQSTSSSPSSSERQLASVGEKTPSSAPVEKTASCSDRAEEKGGMAESTVPTTKLSISSLMGCQARRPGKRRRMDNKCRLQYKEMMAEFRSHAAVLATATKIMIRESPENHTVLEETLESTLCHYAQNLLEKFQQHS